MTYILIILGIYIFIGFSIALLGKRLDKDTSLLRYGLLMMIWPYILYNFNKWLGEEE